MGWLSDFFIRPVVDGFRKQTPPTAQDYAQRVANITQQEHLEVAQRWAEGSAGSHFDPATARDALARVQIAQKELILVKKDIRNTLLRLRASGASARADFPPPHAGTLYSSQIARSRRAAKRRQMRENERSQITPYEMVLGTIDRQLLQYDRTKAYLRGWLSRNRHPL